MKTIQLVCGTGEVLVDDCDFTPLSQYRWRVIRGKGSMDAPVIGRRSGNPKRLVRMTHFIMKASHGEWVRFRNGNTMDLRRENLYIYRPNVDNTLRQKEEGATQRRAELKEELARLNTRIRDTKMEVRSLGEPLTNLYKEELKRLKKRCKSGDIRMIDIRKLHIAQSGMCAGCGIDFNQCGYNYDHIVPISKGGTNGPSNIRLVCPTCNSVKGSE